jgi:hypothetical protein
MSKAILAPAGFAGASFAGSVLSPAGVRRLPRVRSNLVIRTLTLAGLVLAALAVSATAQKDEKEPKEKAKVYKTPQECFDAVLKAIEKKDARAMIDCFTPESQKQMAADFVAQGVFFRAQAEKNEDFAKKYKPLLETLDKHGVTEKATKDLKIKGFRVNNKKDREAILKLVKDPAAFAAAFMTTMDKVEPRPDEKDQPKPKLTDVKIDGDKAKGQVVSTIKLKDKDKEEVKEEKEPVTFEKINGSWRVAADADRKDEEPKSKDKDGEKKDR